jgi:predicted O-methyltransferase YrrM
MAPATEHPPSRALRRDRPSLSLACEREHAAALLAALHDLDYEACDPASGLPPPSDADLGHHLLARPVEQLAGLPVRLHRDVDALRGELGLRFRGVILEDDIDLAENDCELHGRKRRDAEVLCSLARSRPGPCLDLGTSFGRSAFKLATNVGPEHTVFTVNMLPEHAGGAGDQITHVLTREQIGSYCRERGLGNVVQVFADTRRWQPDAQIDGLALAFVDACHDEDAVVADSHLCWQRLRPGGALLWHDFSPIERHRRPWVASVMAGVARFLADIAHPGPVHHLRGSWIGLLEKAAP